MKNVYQNLKKKKKKKEGRKESRKSGSSMICADAFNQFKINTKNYQTRHQTLDLSVDGWRLRDFVLALRAILNITIGSNYPLLDTQFAALVAPTGLETPTTPIIWSYFKITNHEKLLVLTYNDLDKDRLKEHLLSWTNPI